MSSRALRKAQREREEQEQLKRPQEEQAEEEEEDADDGVPLPPTKQSAFAMLGEAEYADEDEDEDEALDEEHIEEEQREPIAESQKPTVSSRRKKKKKKGKGGGKAATDASVADRNPLDEIDQALKALSTNNNSAQTATTAAGVNKTTSELCSLLAIDTSHLHAQNEMRRLFGRAALEQDDQPDANGGGRRRQRGQQVDLAAALAGQRGHVGGIRALGLRRNIFIQGKEEWPIASSGGLGMEVAEKRADGTVEYRYVHNTAYRDVQGQFEACVASMDPQRMVQLLQYNPYHISTLLQVSEIAKQERDHATSGDLLGRALFSFGRAVHSTFSRNLAEGKARMSFRRPENREFWLAAWRYMQNLTMRATWRTVYEWAKLLLSLDPEGDPYAIRLVIDQYALRSRQELDFLNVIRFSLLQEAWAANMPNLELSAGLAEHRSGNKSKGKQALFKAVGKFPWVVARLMQELALDPPPAIWGKTPRSDYETLQSELYATKAKDLWNTPEASALLVEMASALSSDVEPVPVDDADVDETEARHVLLSDTPALIALIPRKWTALLTSSSDPLPPADDLPSYNVTPRATGLSTSSVNGTLASTAENLRELQTLYGFFASLFPWFSPHGQNEGEPEHAQPTEEDIERRIQDSGVGEEVILERTHRMMALQRALMGEQGDRVDPDAVAEHFPTAHVAGEDGRPGEEEQ